MADIETTDKSDKAGLSESLLHDALSDLMEEDSVEIDNTSSDGENRDEAAFFASLDNTLDPEELASKERSLYLEKGLYYFKNPPEHDWRFLSNDRRKGDASPKGRVLWIFTGVVVHCDTKREEYYTITISPDERKFSQGRNIGKPDGFSQGYAKISAYYRKVKGRNSASDKELWQFLKEGEYAFYLSQSNAGNFLGRFQDKLK